MHTRYYVFSTAGKLVYACASPPHHQQHEDGDDDDDDDDDSQASTHVGVLQTLIAIYADDGSDRLRHLTMSSSSASASAQRTTSIVFLLRAPLYLTALCTTSAAEGPPHPPPALLRIHLDALHLQLTSIVPLPKLTRLFSQRPNYDLRARMLVGTEPFLHRLIASLDLASPPTQATSSTGTEGGWPWLLGALQPIKMDPTLRAQLGSALQPPSRQSQSQSQRISSSSPSSQQHSPNPDASSSSNNTTTTTTSIISSVGTVTASTLSLLNPASYISSSAAASSSSSSPSSFPETAPHAAAGQDIHSAPPPRPKDLLYVLVLFRSQLVTLLRPRKHSVHAADMHLLINAARASIASRAREGEQQGPDDDHLESWVPVCLPRFAPAGFVWAHVSLLPKSGIVPPSPSPAQTPTTTPTPTQSAHSLPRRPGLPTHHVSTATASSIGSSASSSANPMHLSDGLPASTVTVTATTTATAQAVASAMRSSLRPSSPSSPSSALSSAAQSRTASPAPPAFFAARHRKPHLLPSTTSSSSTTSLSSLSAAGDLLHPDPDRTVQPSEHGDEDEDDDESRTEAGDTTLDTQRHSIAPSESESASLAETETETEIEGEASTARRQFRSRRTVGAGAGAGEGDEDEEEGEDAASESMTMTEAQEAELMRSISALRSSDAPPTKDEEEGGEDQKSGEGKGTKARGRSSVPYADEADDLTLVLVSGDPDAFPSLSLWRRHILHTLTKRPSSSSSSSSSSPPSILERLVRATSGWKEEEGSGNEEGQRGVGAGAGAGAGTKGVGVGYSADELRIPGLRHFIYKSRTATQLTAPRFEAPYLASPSSPKDQEGGAAWRRLVGLYGLAWEGLHGPAPPDPGLFGLDSSALLGMSPRATDGQPRQPLAGKGEGGGEEEEEEKGPDAPSRAAEEAANDGQPGTSADSDVKDPTPTPTPRAIARTWSTGPASSYAFLRTEHEAVLGWLTAGFELYVCVSPWIRRRAIVGSSGSGGAGGGLVGKVAKWVKEKEESLFLLAPPVF
ncbi:Vacuolar fusion protein mon1 [Tilletia horrida]|uniref:Vacuolar fusion protein MON1 n=1 Tax=Tilletia horrida TaxID=155126 RepID=A0AAN6JN24_9BASI|nr:Vacuolar fusion protein mon1 [Tilletia horrida]